MRLLTAHKIVIGAAVVLALLLTARSLSNYTSTRAPSELGFALAGLVLAIALGVYLRTLWKR